MVIDEETGVCVGNEASSVVSVIVCGFGRSGVLHRRDQIGSSEFESI